MKRISRRKVRFAAAVVAIGLLSVVAALSSPSPPAPKSTTGADLIRQFNDTKVFWRQFEIAQKIVADRDPDVLPELAPWLTSEDRHARGNAAFIFASLGDDRGFVVIEGMLTDRSDRPPGQGIPTPSGDGKYRVERQIAADRYYAAHLLGDLRDPRAVPILIPLLNDREVEYAAPWSLAQIGGPGVAPALIGQLEVPDPSLRVLAIDSLELLGAKEALPKLRTMINDPAKSRFGKLETVGEAARSTIAKLGGTP